MNHDFIPNRHARLQLVAQQLNESHLNEKLAFFIARLVPDLFLLHAVFIEPKTLKIEIIDNYRVFLRYSDCEPLFLGTFTDYGYTRARGFWNTDELWLMGITLSEASDYDLEKAISEYEREKWNAEFNNLQNPRTSLVIDIAAGLREFTGEQQ